MRNYGLKYNKSDNCIRFNLTVECTASKMINVWNEHLPENKGMPWVACKEFGVRAAEFPGLRDTFISIQNNMNLPIFNKDSEIHAAMVSDKDFTSFSFPMTMINTFAVILVLDLNPVSMVTAQRNRSEGLFSGSRNEPVVFCMETSAFLQMTNTTT